MENKNKTLQLRATHNRNQGVSWDENKNVAPGENQNKKKHVSRDPRTNMPLRDKQTHRVRQNQDKNSGLSPNENCRLIQNQFPGLPLS
jgi:hypothetical protein